MILSQPRSVWQEIDPGAAVSVSPRGLPSFSELARRIALLGERAADSFAGVHHLIRLLIAGGVQVPLAFLSKAS
jgi:hypothetical protein